MRASKMQLENYFVEELSFQLRSDDEWDLENPPKLKPSDLEIEVGLGEGKDDTSRKFCHLTIGLKEEIDFPYRFNVVMAGFFTLDSTGSDEEAELLLKITAPSMLFTAARELLLLVTGRTRCLPIMLPTVTFLRGQKSQKAVKNRSKKTSRQVKAPAKKPGKKA